MADASGQSVDRGSQYRSVIFYANDQERQSAEASKKALEASGRFDKPIVTDIFPLGRFTPLKTITRIITRKTAPLPLFTATAPAGTSSWIESGRTKRRTCIRRQDRDETANEGSSQKPK